MSMTHTLEMEVTLDNETEELFRHQATSYAVMQMGINSDELTEETIQFYVNLLIKGTVIREGALDKVILRAK